MPATPSDTATILVADDSVFARRWAERLLADAGHTVVTVAGGERAYAAARASTPDVLVADEALSGFTGRRLVSALREHHADMGMVLVCSSVEPGLEADALRRGVDRFVHTPCRPGGASRARPCRPATWAGTCPTSSRATRGAWWSRWPTARRSGSCPGRSTTGAASSVEFIDSSGLALLADLHREADRLGGRLVIAAPHGPARRIFSLTHTESFFNLADSLEEAEAGVGWPS